MACRYHSTWEYSASLMGFASVHRNVLAASHSRGKGEAVVLDVLDQIGLTLSRMAQDIILFSLPEFGYFKLPAELCTGSSIMPQKKEPGCSRAEPEPGAAHYRPGLLR